MRSGRPSTTTTGRPVLRLLVSLEANEGIIGVRDRQLPQEELLSHRRDAPLAETEHFFILIMNASYHWVHVERSRSASGTW